MGGNFNANPCTYTYVYTLPKNAFSFEWLYGSYSDFLYTNGDQSDEGLRSFASYTGIRVRYYMVYIVTCKNLKWKTVTTVKTLTNVKEYPLNAKTLRQMRTDSVTFVTVFIFFVFTFNVLTQVYRYISYWMVSGEGSGIRLYRFLIIAFSPILRSFASYRKKGPLLYVVHSH